MKTRLKALAAASAACALLTSQAVVAEEGHTEIARQHWSFGGFTGQFDKAQLQRGFLVFKQVCSNCHGLKRLYFRNLVQPGGPEFDEEAVKKLAAEWPNQIPELNDQGESAVTNKDKDNKTVPGFTYVKRPPKLSDPILGPYANDLQARAAQNGRVPPDLTLIAKARNVERDPSWYAHPFLMLGDIGNAYQEGGADYIDALLTSYDKPLPKFQRDDKGKLALLGEGSTEGGKPAGSKAEECASVVKGDDGQPDTCNALQEGLYYNPAFAGHQIGMPPPLSDGLLTAQDGYPLEPVVDNYARDVVAFLSWAGDPTLNQRKRIGWQVMLYLLVTTVLLYLGKKRLWSQTKH